MTPQLVSGTVVGGYRIARFIGSGATGSVYLAEDADGQAVALKVLAPDLANDERFRQRFLRESQLARSLEHPHAVATLSSGEEDGLLYLAMAYVEGSDLREVLSRESRLEPERALHLLGQIAEALDAAHAAGLVHRDVKPGNILVSSSGGDENAYICDFGLARHVSSVSSLTGDRGFAGTIDYVPPEQIEGGTVDGRADVYSLGCVLFECLAGARPFERESELAVVFAHLNEPPPRLSQRRPGLPDALDDVIGRALAKRPEERVPTCGALMNEARSALRGEPIARTRRRRRGLIAGAAVLIVAAAVALGIAWTFRGDGQADAASITPTSIAGAPLGLRAEAYEEHFGKPWQFSTQPNSGHRILTFPNRGIAVYFKGFTDTAVEIITWNGHDRTAAGVGPCSTIAGAKRTYGKAFKPSPTNTQKGLVYAYLLEKNLIFAANGVPPSPTVTAVGLFYGDAPDAAKPGGALSFAGYLAIDATTACDEFTETS